MLEMFSRVNVGKCDSWPIKYKADFPKSRLGSEEWLTFVNCHVLPPPPLGKENKKGSSLVAQQVKDPAFSLQWLGSLG